MQSKNAPNDEKLLRLMERTGYNIIQVNGQRKYGPPPGWNGPPPSRGCEIFVGKLPRDCYEDELVPVFERIGKIYEFRLMMDFSGSNRGYAFVQYTNKNDAKKAVNEIDNFEIRKGRLLGVCFSVDNCKLFVGGIPKTKTREEILQEMNKVTEGVVDVIVYPSGADKTKSRGFAFVEYESHRAAALARRKLIPGTIQLWRHQISVDWAEPEQEVDEETMSKVKRLYVRNLMLSTTEETIKKYFTQALGKDDAIERVRKPRDFAFVHFKERDDALKALELTNNGTIDGAKVEVMLSKPVDRDEHRIYARVKTVPQQPEELGEKELHSQEYHGYSTYSHPPVYVQVYPAPVPGSYIPGRGRPAAGIRIAALRGRGRGAAGTRGAGNHRVPGFSDMDGYNRYLLEENLYDLPLGMEFTPTYPVAFEPQTFKSPAQVTIPAYNTPFQPNKLCRSVDDAKTYSDDFAVSGLGIRIDGPEMNSAPVLPTKSYHGCPNRPAYQSVPDGANIPLSGLIRPAYQSVPDGANIPSSDLIRPAYQSVPEGANIPLSDPTFATTMPAVTSAPPFYVVAQGKIPPSTPAAQIHKGFEGTGWSDSGVLISWKRMEVYETETSH